MGEWGTNLASGIGAAVKAKRLDLGWTAARLSEATAALGYPIHRVAIGKLENGHRGAKFDVAELIVLAEAMDVPPAQLLFPDLPDGVVEYLPDMTTTAFRALTRFTGEVPPNEDTPEQGSREYPLYMMRRRSEMTTARDRHKASLAGAERRVAAFTRELAHMPASAPNRREFEKDLAAAQRDYDYYSQNLPRTEEVGKRIRQLLADAGFTVGGGDDDGQT